MSDSKEKISEDQVKEFKSGLRKWCAEFGLRDWDIRTEEENDPAKEWLAQCQDNVEARCATISINRGQKAVHPMDRLACHELLHLVFSPLQYMTSERVVTVEAVAREVERLCVLFEQVLCEEPTGDAST